MSVQKGNKQRDCWDLITRLARRILDHFGPDHRWRDDELAYREVYRRVQDMRENTLFRYSWCLMHDPVNMKAVANFYTSMRLDCNFDHYSIDHVADLSMRDIMVFLVCRAVMDRIEMELGWDYFDYDYREIA